MATTISGPAVTDDTGTVASPNEDGTNLNQAFFNSLYAAINAMWSGATQVFDGVLSVGGLGTHTFSAGGAGHQIVRSINTAAGAGNAGTMQIGNNADADLGRWEAYSSTYTEAGAAKQNGVALRAMGAGGLWLAAEAAGGDVFLSARGTTQVVTYNGRDFQLAGANPGPVILSGVLTDSVNTTQVGTDANTSAKTLHSYTLPASALSNNGQAIKIIAAGTFAANDKTKTIRIKFGGATVGDWDASGAGALGGGWHIEAIVFRTTASAQKAICSVLGSGVSTNFTMAAGGATAGNNHQYTEPANTLTNSQAIIIEGQNGTANANDIVCEFSYVELLSGA